MEDRSHHPGRARRPRPHDNAAGSVAEDDFSHQITAAENMNLRERVGRLESSIAFWAADVDEAIEENAQLRAEIDALQGQIRDAQDQLVAAKDEKVRLVAAIDARDAHIVVLQGQLADHELAEIDAHRIRSRLHSLRQRVRARMKGQAQAIEGLRRTVSLGHAARLQVEEELRACRVDAARNALYLDKLERRLRFQRSSD